MSNMLLFAVDIVYARLMREEGCRIYPYNDANDQRVTCRPTGNLTWLYGFNLEEIGSPELGQMMLRWLIQQEQSDLMRNAWYQALDGVRQSVLLDIAYNDGMDGLLSFHLMLAALQRDPPDYGVAAAQLLDSDAARKLSVRYGALAQILRTGVLS